MENIFEYHRVFIEEYVSAE